MGTRPWSVPASGLRTLRRRYGAPPARPKGSPPFPRAPPRWPCPRLVSTSTELSRSSSSTTAALPLPGLTWRRGPSAQPPRPRWRWTRAAGGCACGARGGGAAGWARVAGVEPAHRRQQVRVRPSELRPALLRCLQISCCSRKSKLDFRKGRLCFFFFWSKIAKPLWKI